jgi:peptide chain release factor 3
VVYRLTHEYGAEVRLLPANYYGARWISGEAAEVRRLVEAYPHLIVKDAGGVLAFLAPSKAELEVRQERYDKVRFHSLREYAGLEEEAPA